MERLYCDICGAEISKEYYTLYAELRRKSHFQEFPVQEYPKIIPDPCGDIASDFTASISPTHKPKEANLLLCPECKEYANSIFEELKTLLEKERIKR